jgi:hypothetical protein
MMFLVGKAEGMLQLRFHFFAAMGHRVLACKIDDAEHL